MHINANPDTTPVPRPTAPAAGPKPQRHATNRATDRATTSPYNQNHQQERHQTPADRSIRDQL